LRGMLNERDVGLAIEQTQRIALEALLAVVAQFVEVRLPEVVNRLPDLRTTDRVTDGIDLETQLQPEFAPQFIDHQDDFGVTCRVGAPEPLDAELVELPIATLLWPLATEHRARVIQALLGITPIEPGLDVCAHHAGGALGAQRERRLGFVLV